MRAKRPSKPTSKCKPGSTNSKPVPNKGVDQARSEAADLRTKMMEEAKQLSRRLEQEAQRTAAVELEKAKAELRTELLEKALVATEREV